MVKGYDYGVTPARLDVVDFDYLPRGLTGNRRDRKGTCYETLARHARRKARDQVRARGY